jgi:hypothetical protein
MSQSFFLILGEFLTKKKFVSDDEKDDKNDCGRILFTARASRRGPSA